MPRIAAALAGLALVVFCIGFNIAQYPRVWEMAAVPEGATQPEESPQAQQAEEPVASPLAFSAPPRLDEPADDWADGPPVADPPVANPAVANPAWNDPWDDPSPTDTGPTFAEPAGPDTAESTMEDYYEYDATPYEPIPTSTADESASPPATERPADPPMDPAPGIQRLPPVDPNAPVAADPYVPLSRGDPIPFYPTIEAK